MKIQNMILLLGILFLGATSLAVLQADAETNRVQLPELDGLVHYTTVRRGDVTEHIMTTPEAMEAIKKGQPVPFGTHFVLVDYRDGKVYRYFVMENGKDWGKDYATGRQTADWQFQWFWADKSINMKENTARCQSCHTSRSNDQYLYTLDQLRAFDGTVVE